VPLERAGFKCRAVRSYHQVGSLESRGRYLALSLPRTTFVFFSLTDLCRMDETGLTCVFQNKWQCWPGPEKNGNFVCFGVKDDSFHELFEPFLKLDYIFLQGASFDRLIRPSRWTFPVPQNNLQILLIRILILTLWTFFRGYEFAVLKVIQLKYIQCMWEKFIFLKIKQNDDSFF